MTQIMPSEILNASDLYTIVEPFDASCIATLRPAHSRAAIGSGVQFAQCGYRSVVQFDLAVSSLGEGFHATNGEDFPLKINTLPAKRKLLPSSDSSV